MANCPERLRLISSRSCSMNSSPALREQLVAEQHALYAEALFRRFERRANPHERYAVLRPQRPQDVCLHQVEERSWGAAGAAGARSRPNSATPPRLG
jgi:hypothetical protein